MAVWSGFYLSGVDASGAVAASRPVPFGPQELTRFVDAVCATGDRRRSILLTRWLRGRALVPCVGEPSRRWIADRVRSTVAGQPLPPGVLDAVVDAVHRNSRRPASVRLPITLPPLVRLIVRDHSQPDLIVHLDAAPKVPLCATRARVTTIGVPDATEVYRDITSPAQRRGAAGEVYGARVPRVIPRLPRRWLRSSATQVATSTPEMQVTVGPSGIVATDIDASSAWHRAPRSRECVIRIETSVLVFLPINPRLLKASLGPRARGVVGRVLAWPDRPVRSTSRRDPRSGRPLLAEIDV